MKINYGKHFIDDEDCFEVSKVLKSNFLTQGPLVSKFEKSLTNFFGSKYAIAVSSGTSALYLSIKNLDLPIGSKIITTPLSFVATTSAIILNNFTPVFSDINLNNFSIDLDILESNLKKDKKIKAIIAVDYAGNTCSWAELAYLKKKYNLYLINDNCHAMGSQYNNSLKYAANYADIVTQSYHPVKNFTTGEGGAILTNNLNIFNKIKISRNHGIKKIRKDINKFGNWYYDIHEPSFNFRITEIQSALGISQLKKLKKFTKKRQLIAKKYDLEFKNNENFILPKPLPRSMSSYHLYTLLINFDKLKKSKKSFFNKMKQDNINLQVHYIPIYKFKFMKKYNIKKFYFKNTEFFYKSAVSLPIYYSLKSEEQEYVIDRLKYHLNVL